MSPQQAAKGLLSHWPLIMAIVAGAIAWGTASAEIAALKERTAQVSENRERLIRIEEKVEGLRADLDQIWNVKNETRRNVDRLQDDVTELSTSFDVTTERILYELQMIRGNSPQA